MTTDWDDSHELLPENTAHPTGLAARRRLLEAQMKEEEESLRQGSFPQPEPSPASQNPLPTSQSALLGALSRYNPFIPTYAWVYWLVVILVTPLALLTAQSYWAPLWESLTTTALQDADTVLTQLPLHFYIKFALFAAFTVVVARHCLTTLRQSYILAWAPAFERPDPLHVDFAPHPVQSLQALERWARHRFLVIAVPPLTLLALCVGLAWLGFATMNSVMDISTLAMPPVVTLFLFLGLMLGLLTWLSFLHGVWLLVTTAFGDAIAQTEPDLSPQTVFERSRRIAFCSPFVWVLYPLVVGFWGVFIAEVVGFLSTYGMANMLDGTFPWGGVVLAEVLTIAGYLLLHWLSLFCYHHALAVYYRQLPSAFRERFSRPDELVV